MKAIPKQPYFKFLKKNEGGQSYSPWHFFWPRVVLPNKILVTKYSVTSYLTPSIQLLN